MKVPECAFRPRASWRIMPGDYKARSPNVNLICNKLARAVAPLPDSHDLSVVTPCGLLSPTFNLALICLIGNDIGADNDSCLGRVAALISGVFEPAFRRKEYEKQN